MFKNFTAQKSEVDWNDGVPIVNIRRITPDFIAEQLDTTSGEGQRIQVALVEEGWIEPEKFTPTRKGMALSQHDDRPKLPRAEAEALLAKVLDWAERTNAATGARVKVKTVHLYGSLLQGVDEVGDVDLFVEFNTMGLDMDLQPEDMERENELSEELASISDYISPSSALDREMMADVPMRQVFP
ncbi:MAG: hypothetical protein DI533_22070 [Cereibacter sphaeroides]|uniref:Uncharacterized protein n=1 Tax=Cereibacter sphaeroides TaxID=1063 RepID=A0A2W5S0B3_CERSP|nr:MAG: hypothetical protein DI533_22070 [Cereibacter sphaeroides]